MSDQSRATLSTIVIVACILVLGILAYAKVDGAATAAFGTIAIVIAWLTRAPGAPDKIDPPGGAKLVPIVAIGAVIADLVLGCEKPPAMSVENAAAVVQYEVLLTDCRKRGKAAKSYDVYEACADAVDRQLCIESRVRCVDGGAP